MALTYGEGSVYPMCATRWGCPPPESTGETHANGKPRMRRPEHKCQARWGASIENGWKRTPDGRTIRDRKVITGKTRRDVVRKLNAKRKELDKFGDSGWDHRTTVRQWVETYLERRGPDGDEPLSPKGYKAAAQPLNKWVLGTIGHRRVADLTPKDIRAVDRKQYDTPKRNGAPRSSSTVAATRRALFTCLRAAKADGAPISENVFLVKMPEMAPSDRLPMSLAETIRCIYVAERMPDGLRWVLALLYGVRQGEALGLVEKDPLEGTPIIDFDNHVIHLRWQLQEIDYVDPKNKALGFKIPRGYVAVHLTGRYHLTKPKTDAGDRVLAMVGPVEDAMRDWLDARPANPWGLVFPDGTGQPANEQDDRAEWYAIQETATVEGLAQGLPPILNPKRRPDPLKTHWYFIHECRNYAATELDEVGASDVVVTSLLGHTDIKTSRGYQVARIDAQRAVLEKVAKRMGLSGDAAAAQELER